MKKAILAALSGVALFGIAACSDTDDTTTQSVNPPLEEQAPAIAPAPIDPAPSAEPAPEAAPSDDAAPMEPSGEQPAPAQ